MLVWGGSVADHNPKHRGSVKLTILLLTVDGLTDGNGVGVQVDGLDGPDPPGMTGLRTASVRERDGLAWFDGEHLLDSEKTRPC